jgi:phage protein D
VTALQLELSQDAPPELVVLAEDALQRARMARRTKLHEALSIAQLARDVASAAELRAVVTGFDSDIGDHMQLNESDLAFLRRLLCAYDGDLQVVGDELHVSPRGEVRRGSVELEMFSQLTRARVSADLSDQVTGISVTGWDAEQAQRIAVQSRGASLGPGQGRPGSTLLRQGIGARVEHVGHRGVQTAGEASKLADACFDQRARRFVVVQGTAEGNPSLRVGSHVAIRGMSPRFDNTYYVTGATHRFDQQQGYETDFEAECAFFNGGGA